MCGRFTLSADYDSLRAAFLLRAALADYTPRYNIAPGQEVLAITEGSSGREISGMRWGLIPHWAKETKTQYKMINARAETLDQKPAFRDSFLHRRCLIPADGFYEWKKQDGRKQPMRIVLPDKPVFAFAGIWDCWNAPEGGTVHSCSIITTTASKRIVDVHDRMPVILDNERQYDTWLKQSEPAALNGLLQPYRGEIVAYPVSALVNYPKIDSPELIKMVSDNNFN